MPNCGSQIAGSFLRDCLNSNGGIKEIKIKPWDSASTGISVASGVGTATGAGLTGWKTFECEPETSMGKDAGTTDAASGTTVYDQEVNYINNKLKSSFRNTLNSLHGMRTWVLVYTENGDIILFGYERGMITATSEGSTGTAFNERSGYSVNFKGREKQPKIFMASATAWSSYIDA